MYRLITNKDELVLVYNNRTVFKHTLSRPFITVGFSTLNYKSTHGAFKVKETGKGKKLALFDYKIRENIIAFSCGETKLEVTILENDNGLDMTFIKQGNFTNITFDFYAAKEECIFGGGEQFRKLNMKGEKIINFVSEHIKIRPIALKLLFGKIYYRERRHSEIETYSPMSTFVSSHRYAIRVDTNDYGINDFKQGDSTLLTYWGTPDRISYFCADSFKELSRKLNNDIPCNEYLPDWAYDGMILGVQGGIERSMDKALAMKAAGAAVCGIWCQDWSGRKITAAGKQVYWNWEVDNRSYGDLKTKIAELKDICFRYQKNGEDVLNSLNLSVKLGEILSIVGSNGSGKTTLLNIISGLTKPYRGSVRFLGKDIKDYKGGELYRNNLSLLPQNPEIVFLKSTVQEDFSEVLSGGSCTKEQAEKIQNKTVDLLNIGHLLTKHPYDLS
ncbi:MAG: ATP-binding cassette domain-containing protein, partial [Clostridia bacterium]|nr:ATP-binding cassette domain-containing protein [Clostridia bacterium]